MEVASGSLRRFEFSATNLLDLPAVGGVVVTFRDVNDRRELEDKLRHLALYDPLTGLANRRLLIERIDHAIALAARSSRNLGVIYLDLDGFKGVNDAYGHDSGDNLLKAFAIKLGTVLRPGDTLGRLGGDEFAVVLEHSKVRAKPPRSRPASTWRSINRS